MKSWCWATDGNGGAVPRTIDRAGASAPDHGFVWCHLDGRLAEERAWLDAESNLSPGVIAALTAVETRPRAEAIGDGALINMRGLGSIPDEDSDPLVSIRLWAEKGRVISVGFRPLAASETVRDQMRAGAIHDPGDLIAALAMAITETLDPQVAAMGDSIDTCEADLDPERIFAMRRIIARTRSDAIQYRRFVTPQRQALERLAVLKADWLEEEDRLHLRDAADRFARMAEELEAVRERAALLHEQLTDLRAEQIDTRTLLISVVALVFLPLTFLTGLLGMNVRGIPYAEAPWAFWGVVGVCAAIAGLITAYFLRAHWFRG
ncbi:MULTISPECIES: zinc transporter ZntB [Sphingomonadales]|uniref:Zinc transporter ZntB n=2 Tax=Edaphosphingomonas TaxID=3423724 RepID=A0A2T4I8P1_9SPHN|nr:MULTISPECIES: zinc transporter ZntB [Sphingomonas]AGH49827.1 Mg2 transporter protein CorA family protein [Sphingomonas sp. MM-1]MDX3883913.1 zinc transporter ZntB [Sphingomonas sp.]OHT18143.1 Zinc transport protein ZntB [Sphingomonas haloaromaticamans]PTD28054.1 zinc transporter ZntB [Sphingomonas fennica]